MDRTLIPPLLCTPSPRPSLSAEFADRPSVGDVRVCHCAYHQPGWVRIRESTAWDDLVVDETFGDAGWLMSGDGRVEPGSFEVVEEEQARPGLQELQGSVPSIR